jgi:hypothetical protein
MKPEIQTTINRLHISGNNLDLLTALKWQVYGEVDATCKAADKALDLAIWKKLIEIIREHITDRTACAKAVGEYFSSAGAAWVVEYKGKEYLNQKFIELWARRNELT